MPFNQEDEVKTVKSFVERHEAEEALILKQENNRLSEGDAKAEEEFEKTIVVEDAKAKKTNEEGDEDDKKEPVNYTGTTITPEETIDTGESGELQAAHDESFLGSGQAGTSTDAEDQHSEARLNQDPDQHEDQQPQLDLSFDKEDGGVEPGDITEHQSVEQEENSMPELEFNNLVSSIMDELKQDNRQYLKEVEMEFAIKPESDMDSLTARSHI